MRPCKASLPCFCSFLGAMRLCQVSGHSRWRAFLPVAHSASCDATGPIKGVACGGLSGSSRRSKLRGMLLLRQGSALGLSGKNCVSVVTQVSQTTRGETEGLNTTANAAGRMIEAAPAELLATAGEIEPAASHLQLLAGEVGGGAAYSFLVDAAAVYGAAKIACRACIGARGALPRLAAAARRLQGLSRRIRRARGTVGREGRQGGRAAPPWPPAAAAAAAAAGAPLRFPPFAEGTAILPDSARRRSRPPPPRIRPRVPACWKPAVGARSGQGAPP